MRILYVTDALAICGGLERILIEKVNLLASMYGYEMYVVTVNQGDHPLVFPLSEQVHFRDLRILFHQQFRYKGFKRLMKMRELNRLFRQWLIEHIQQVRPDVIVSVRADQLDAILEAKGNIPLVFESHVSRYAQRFSGANTFYLWQSTWFNRKVRHADRVVALTEGDASDWRSLNPHVSVIPNVVHLNESGGYSSCEHKRAIFVGRFSEQKDIGSLLRIWEMVNSRHPDWQLDIYGGYGGEYEVFMAAIRQSHSHIVVHDATSEIFKAYRESSMLLLTSRYEPFGLVLPEAMSCGLPVVAFDCPYGPADIITDGVDGFLIANRDVFAFADRVCQLIESRELRLEMGQAGVVSSRRYEATRVMPLWKNLFERLVEKSG